MQKSAKMGGSSSSHGLDQESAQVIMTWLHNNNYNDTTTDLTDIRIKDTLRYVYPLFILVHAAVFLVGTTGNVAMLVVIIRRRLYRSPTFFFLCNLALSDVIKAAIVLPITLGNLLIQHWIFGSFLCFFLPMMQSFPIHASILTYMMIAVDRYRLIVHPMKARVPAGLCTIGVWVVSICAVLPYAVYIKYVDLEAHFGEDFNGLGICWVDVDRPIEGYIRAMFVIMFCLPLAIITFLYVRVSAELAANSETPSMSVHIEDNAQSLSETSYQSRLTWLGPECDHLESATSEREHSPAHRGRRHRHHHSHDDDWQPEINMFKEKRSQKYLITMVILFAMCWCPIHILILVTHFVYEDDDNHGHFDITYLTFTFFGYLSCCTNAVLFASWRMSTTTKDRLRGYFRFSTRSSRRASSLIRGSWNRAPGSEPEQHSPCQAGPALGDVNSKD